MDLNETNHSLHSPGITNSRVTQYLKWPGLVKKMNESQTPLYPVSSLLMWKYGLDLGLILGKKQNKV